ncbi:hypothetical protein B0H13DRAFT_2348911 [Mycena leptocephala]|nr:hypothetical protein B0H13DRAFT_2348911 [Mycena leptocephala]
MSLSRVRPGDAESNPLVLDARGHLVQQLSPTRPARRIIHEGPPSTINPHVRHKRRVAVSVVVHSPLDEIATRDAEGRRRSTRDMVAEMHAQEARAHSPGEGPSRLAVTVDEAPSSPEVTITGFRAVRVNAPSSPEITITGYRAPPRPLMPASPTPARPIRHSIIRFGARTRLSPPVAADNLWLTDERPRTTTSSRPTTYAESVMGSSPTLCRTGVATATVMYASEPHRHWGEEAGLRAAYPGWDVNTKVKGTWKGLKFPSA